MIGSMNDDVIFMEELACDLLKLLRELYPEYVAKRYEICWEEMPEETLQEIARSRGCLSKGENLDLKKASVILLDDFRSGRMGRITLERP